MKLFLISDIHGSEYYLKKALEQFYKEKADYIIILGDILYHGARNDLPFGHNPKGVIKILNEISDKIIAVKGNCDSDVDEMVLDFPVESIYSNLLIDDRRMFLTHGHKYNKNNMPNLPENSIFIYGHTHIFEASYKDEIYFINPGSISIPKGGNPSTYAIYKDNFFIIKDIEGKEIKKIEINI